MPAVTYVWIGREYTFISYINTYMQIYTHTHEKWNFEKLHIPNILTLFSALQILFSG